jgi:mRNA-degrading endonuclease RelE of RelBE toxin-antitoxin system
VYEIRFTRSAEEDLQHFGKADQRFILATIRAQLLHEPLTETTNRKFLRPNPLGGWELRAGDFRVFYDPDPETRTVSVGAVGIKDHNTLYVRGKVFQI